MWHLLNPRFVFFLLFVAHFELNANLTLKRFITENEHDVLVFVDGHM